ncbi:MAG: hypothetical protein HQK60_00465 [Deltaproteobacteria bacterium]|nr:hypothetical protein [Deltaproteobacteria bacterium]
MHPFTSPVDLAFPWMVYRGTSMFPTLREPMMLELTPTELLTPVPNTGLKGDDHA